MQLSTGTFQAKFNFEIEVEEHQKIFWEEKRQVSRTGTGLSISWGMRHTSTALYFYGASKKSLHKSKNTFENRSFHISCMDP